MSKNGERPRGLYEAPFKIERPEKASQTLLAHLDRCAYSGALYVKHKGGPQTPAMARGEAFHDFAEQATNMLVEQGEPNMPSEVAKDLMQAILEERVDLSIPTDEQDACRLMAWNWGHGTMLDLEALGGVEQMLELDLGKWTIRGKLDRWEVANNTGIVTDYKTSKAIPPVEKYENSFQPQMYALLMAEGVPEGEATPLGKGLDGIHTHEVYPRYRREEDGQLVYRYAFYDRAKLHDFKQTVLSLLTKLEHGLKTQEWVASPGSHCSICPASSECPITPEVRGVATIGTAGEALEFAEREASLAREHKVVRAAIKTWVDENGRLVMGDEAWDFHIEERETSDKDALKALISEHELPVGEFYKVAPSTRFKKKKVEAA